MYGQHFRTLLIIQQLCQFHSIKTRCKSFKISPNLHNFATNIFLHPSFKVDDSKLPWSTDPSPHSCCICIDMHKSHPLFLKIHTNCLRVTEHTQNKPNFTLKVQIFTSKVKYPLKSAHSIEFTALSGVGEPQISVGKMCIIII